MLIIHGTKVVRRRLGWVADFCPICRDLTPFAVTSVKKITHLYYIPLGKGKIAIHELTCNQCAAEYGSKSPSYAAYADEPTADIAALAARTTPDLIDRCGPRLDLEDRLADRSLTQDERDALILEPIAALQYMALKHKAAGAIPTGAGFAIIGFIFTAPVAIVLWTDPTTRLAAAIASGFCLLFAALAIRGCIKGARSTGKLIPLLARALAPMDPTEDELAAALQKAASLGQPAAKRLTPQELSRAIAGLNVGCAV